MSTRFQSTFFGGLKVEFEFDAQIGSMTHYAIGGRAEVLVKPKSVDSLCELLKRCYQSEAPLRILGKGANLLIDDIGVDGVVVKLDEPCFKSTHFNREGSIDSLKVMAGADMSTTIMDTARRGLDGLTAMSGIPATIGGAIRMNAGGKYGSISDSLDSVTCITKEGETVTYDAHSIDFGYRESKISEPLILSATFKLLPYDPILIRERVLKIYAWKRTRQPLAEASAGCVFKNPIGKDGERISAGQLIDECGLKGEKIGGASISKSHANFIVTSPQATSRHVIELMELVQTQVFDETGIQLQNEIVIWSQDSQVQR